MSQYGGALSINYLSIGDFRYVKPTISMNCVNGYKSNLFALAESDGFEVQIFPLLIFIKKNSGHKLCAKPGAAGLVSNSVKRVGTEEPYEGNLHVRVCGGSAGQPVLLPGNSAF